MNTTSTKREEIIYEILELIRKMKIPSYRKSSQSTDNMRWLNRNLGVRNYEHPNYAKVMELLKTVI